MKHLFAVWLSLATLVAARGESLPVFRVDSPMKGEYSEADDRTVSFQVVTIDTDTRRMSVRAWEWNRPIPAWGPMMTVQL